MEEDNCEENLKPKKKKQKKKASHHESEIGTMEVKKEKKCKKVKMVAKEEEGLNESGEHEEKKKIKKKRKVDSNFVKEAIDEEKTMSKKKKKTRLANDDKLENIQIVVKEEKVEKRKKLKDPPIQNKTESKTEEEQIQKDEIPKKGKKIKSDDLTGNPEQSGNVKKRKKKKDRLLTAEGAFTTKTKRKLKVEENGTKSEEPEKRKLKKKKEGLTYGLEETEKSKKKRETKVVKILKKYKNDDEKETFPEEEKVTDEGKPKKKKKRIKEKPGTISVEDVNEEETEPKKKRKKAKADEESRENYVTMSADAQIKKGKKNKTVLKVKKIDPAAKKIKEEQKDSYSEENDLQVSIVDVVFLSKKNGNTDEIDINQDRRKALQMEIDVASQPKKTTKPMGLGQWSTAQFDDSDQQQKFLRLMGGFKKGFQPAVGTSGGGGMALGKDAQQRLQQGLMGEFERAHSRRMDFSKKGAGLGFNAPPNKKFFIDVNASRSIRFDD
ncbi:lysine-rich nucleolar protein 1 [Nothobranchius furzeri]|uniref:Chromosome 16 open reading frame 88 n=1 Tax=Nothobranchius furzeri TaxID=105023 RepID=A0A1A8AKW9_NOTFU|nr:lysine-rich nucleolar protein 1 [Nothobranchius furzeri]KAF7218009.1 lysine-rich nucleolar protein 1 [Nothobranchius furzeri]